MSQQLLRFTGVLLFILIVVLLVLGLGIFQLHSLVPQNVQQKTSVYPRDVVESFRADNYQKAILSNLEVQNDPKKTAEEKAVSAFNSFGSGYRVSGDENTLLLDIQKMKRLVQDQSLSLTIRVDTLDVLAKEYAITGRDPVVFAEIYKDAPFNTYLAAGDPDLSSRHLAEWSYSMMPSSNAAIMVATWYTEQLVTKLNLAPTTTKAYSDLAVDFLKKADAASLEESKKDTEYSNSRRYLYFRFYRTVVIGRLANQLSEYKSQYRHVYDDFITLAKSKKNEVAKEFLLYTHLSYAQQLTRDGDKDQAKVQLDLLAEELKAIPDADAKTNGFIRSLKNEQKYRPTGRTWLGFDQMFNISSNFKVTVVNLITSSSTPQ